MDKAFPHELLDFRIREVSEGDENKLSEFYHKLSSQSRYFFEPYSDTSPQAMKTVVNNAVSGTDQHFVVEDRSGEFLAHIFFRNVCEEVPHLGIGILDAYQDVGFGAVLMQYLIAIGKYRLNKKRIGLTVMKENTRAFRLYQKMGFEVVREDVSFRTSNDSYEMHKKL